MTLTLKVMTTGRNLLTLDPIMMMIMTEGAQARKIKRRVVLVYGEAEAMMIKMATMTTIMPILAQGAVHVLTVAQIQNQIKRNRDGVCGAAVIMMTITLLLLHTEAPHHMDPHHIVVEVHMAATQAQDQEGADPRMEITIL